MADNEEDFSKMTIEERIEHKSWKARVSGYADLTKALQMLDPIDEANTFRKYSHFLTKILNDPNQVSNEAGLNVILAYIEFASDASSFKDEFFPTLAVKGLGSTRQGTKSKALDIVLMFVEIEVGEDIINHIIKELDNKQPKVVAGCIMALKEIVAQFGARTLNIKPVLKNLGKMFAHSDKNVRAEAFTLALTIYSWLNKAIDPFLGDLKPVQLKDLNAQFEKVGKVKPMAQRYLRSQKPSEIEEIQEEDAAEEGEDEEDSLEEDPVDVDPYEFAEPVDITNKIPGNFYTELASKKWKERKEALDALKPVVDTIKLSDNGPYNELVGALAAHINDTNVVVGILAINCIEYIAKGLRASFSAFKPTVLPPLLEKLKEKKQTFVDALRGALDAVFNSTSLSDVLEEVVANLSHKNPQVKAETARYLTRMLREIKSPPSKGEVKKMCEGLLKTIQDGDTTVRETSAECLGTLMKVVGEKIIGPFIDGLDNLKSAKAKEYCDKATIQVKQVKAAAPSKPTPTKKSVASKKPIAKPSLSKPPSKLPSKPSIPTSVAPRTDKVTPKKPVTVAKKVSKPTGKDIVVSFRFSDEDVDANIGDFLSSEILEGLQGSVWKVRLEAMEQLISLIESAEDGSLEPELLVRQLSKKPGWKEANFQVTSKMFSAFQMLCSTQSKFSAGCASLTIPYLVDKLGDIKLKKPAGDTLEIYAEKLSVKFILSQCYPLITSVKSPKIQGDALLWVKQCLNNFGIATIPVRPLIEFAAGLLGSSNATVRSNAVKLLAEVRVYAGSDIKNLIQDINSSLLSTIESEFEKVANRRPPTPSRFEAGSKKPTSNDKEISESVPQEDNTNDDMMDDLFPRVDISSKIDDELIAKLRDASWKIRKEGIDYVAQLLESNNKRIKPNIGELATALRGRLEDPNKNLVYYTLDLCALLATSIGKDFEKVGSSLIGPICNCLNDLKPNVRGAAVKALSSMNEASGLNYMLSSISAALTPETQNLRKELLTWLIDPLSSAKKYSDLPSIVTPLMLCLHDKNSDVRKKSQKCLESVTTLLGYPAIREKCMALKPAFQASVLQVIDEFKSAKGSSVPTTTAESVQLEKSASTGLKRSNTIVRRTPVPKTQPKSQEAPSTKVKAPILSGTPSQKVARLSKDKPNRWIFDSPPSDLVESLIEACQNIFSPDLKKLLFSKDTFKDRDHINGLTQLGKLLEDPDYAYREFGLDIDEIKSRFMNASDLLFKILVIRLYDQGTTILIKSLDLLYFIFKIFEDTEEKLSDTEAAILLPTLAIKLGLNNETLRKKSKDLVRQLCNIYPSSKVFASLLINGLNSKNSRARSEALDELGSLIQKEGLSVCGNTTKSLTTIASNISDRDAAVRNAAISAIAQVYVIVGPQVYRYLGQLSEKDKGYLEERFKRTKTNASLDEPTEKMSRKSPEEHQFSFQKQPEIEQSKPINHQYRKSITPNYEAQPIASVLDESENINLNHMDHFVDTDIPKKSEIQGGYEKDLSFPEKAMVEILKTLKTGDYYQVIDCLNELEKLIAGPIDEIIPFINQLMLNISNVLENVFGKQRTSSRLFLPCLKQVVMALNQVFSNSILGESISGEALASVIKEVLYRLLDQKLNGSYDSTELSRQLNTLMVKMLDNTNCTATFQALLNLMKECMTFEQTSLVERQVRYSALLMKCLWKMTRTISNKLELNELAADKLLSYINDFFSRFPVTHFTSNLEGQNPQADLVFKTIKTIIFELCAYYKMEIFEHLTDIPVGTPNDHLSSYINHLLTKFDLDEFENSGSKFSHFRQNEIHDPLVNESLNTFLESILIDFRLDAEPSSGFIKTLFNFLSRHPNYYRVYQEILQKRDYALFEKVDGCLKEYERSIKRNEYEPSPINYHKSSSPEYGYPPHKKASPQQGLQNLTQDSISNQFENQNSDTSDFPRHRTVADLRARLAALRLANGKDSNSMD